jgi:hypothetical protein
MSTSPIVSDQLHKHNTMAPHSPAQGASANVIVPAAEPKVWASVDLPSLNLSDPVGTTVTLPLSPSAPAATLKNPVAEPTNKASTTATEAALDDGLAERMAQLRAKSASLRRDTEAVRRTTGTLK